MENISRRQFLNSSVRGAALGAAAVSLVPHRVLGANEKVVLALIGAGGRGSVVIQAMTKLKDVETKYVCDVDDSRGGWAMEELEKIQGFAPKRIIDMKEVFDDKDVDGVVIATPEHWHALATVWACQAGKDVMVEKSISRTIWESRKMVEAARKYNRIVQCGTQNRSATYAFSAREYIKSGKLGRVVHVKVYHMLPGGGWRPRPDSQTPAGLDWDRWLGPTAMVPYNVGRHRGWSNYWEYSSGMLGGGATHQMDLARLVLDNPPHPKAVYCAGGRLAFDDERQTPDTQIVTYDFGKFTMTCEMLDFTPYNKKSQEDVRFGDKFPYWPQNGTRIEIYGTKRMMYVGRMGGGWQVFEGDGKVVDYEYGYYPDELHNQNFMDCIRSRKMPNGDIEYGHYSASLAHLGNLAYRAGNEKLIFDAKTETFVNSDEANKLLKPVYRKPYYIPDQV
jgi:predicted dehydrogenase